MSVDFGLLTGSALLALAAVLVGTCVVSAMARDSSERTFLFIIFVVALGLRLGLSVVTYIKFPYGYFAPDEVGTVEEARNYLNVVTLNSPASHGQGWIFFNILVFHIFGTEPLLPRLWNCVVGAMTPLLGYMLARDFGAARGARWSAILIAFFPSAVLWSSLNLHDVDVYFVILLALLLATRVQESPRWWRVVAVSLTLAAIYLLRLFSDAALLVAIACGVLASRLRIPARLARRIVIAIAAIIVGSVIVAVLFPRPGQYLYTRLGLGQIAGIRHSLASGARSAVDTDPGLQTPVAALSFLPRGLIDFFLRPFPWEHGSSLSVLTRPETILYYALIPVIAAGIVLTVKKAALRAIPSLVFIAITGLGYSFVLSNLGTIYRERDELLIVMFTFVGVAVDAIAKRLGKQRLGTSSRPASRPTGGRSGGQVQTPDAGVDQIRCSTSTRW